MAWEKCGATSGCPNRHTQAGKQAGGRAHPGTRGPRGRLPAPPRRDLVLQAACWLLRGARVPTLQQQRQPRQLARRGAAVPEAWHTAAWCGMCQACCCWSAVRWGARCQCRLQSPHDATVAAATLAQSPQEPHCTRLQLGMRLYKPSCGTSVPPHTQRAPSLAELARRAVRVFGWTLQWS